MKDRPIDRRLGSREALFTTRRRFARVTVETDVFYESDRSFWMAEKANVGLRGLFVPCGTPDPEGTRAIVRLDIGDGPMVRFETEVIRAREIGTTGMALRVVRISDEDRHRLAAFLLRKGGLPVMPQLDRKFRTLTRAPRPRPQ